MRYKFIQLLLDEECGDIRKLNVLGYLPFQIEHHQPLNELPLSILQYIPSTLQELQEHDYVIISPVDKKDLVMD